MQFMFYHAYENILELDAMIVKKFVFLMKTEIRSNFYAVSHIWNVFKY